MNKINIHHQPPFISNKENIVASRTGDISYCYEMILPEKHSLSEKAYDALLDIFEKAFRNFENHTVIHKTDFFMKRLYNDNNLPTNSFLQKTFKAHHSKKYYTEHKAYLFFTYTLSDFINKGEISNPFSILSQSKELLNEIEQSQFNETVNNVVEYVNKKKRIYLKKLNDKSIGEFSRTYFNGLLEGVYTDVDGTKANDKKQGIKIGDRFVDLYSINSLSQLPQKLTNIVIDDDIAKEGITFHQGITESFGLGIPYDHIVNQILYLPKNGKLLNDISKIQSEFYGARGFGLNATPAEKISKWIKYVQENKSTRLIKSHFNVIVLTDNQNEREQSRSFTRALFTDRDIQPYLPTGNALNALYQQSFFAFSSQIPNRFTFISELRMACALLLPTSSYKSDREGLFFNERVFNTPIRRDIWDVKKRRIKARNFFIIAPTGEGKSTLSNHLCYQFIDQGYKLCINDLGKSYQNLYRMYKSRSAMLEFRQGQPLGINPFKLDSGSRENIPSEHILFVNDVLNLLYYKGSVPPENQRLQQDTSLRKIISSYYANVEQLDLPTFYKYFQFIHKENRYEDIGIDPSAYNPVKDMGEMLYSLSEFSEGIYSYLFQPSKKKFEISPETDFVYFEFDEAQGDPMLLSLLQLYSYQATKTVIWNDKSVRGIQLNDEFAKQLKSPQVAAMSEFIAQAIRKQNGGAGFVIQSVAQLPKNDTIGAMLDNTSVFYILPSAKGHAETAERLRLPQHQKFMLDSIESDFSGKDPYSEIFLKMDAYAAVVRVQLPKEHFYTFQTEGDLYNKIEKLYKDTGSMEQTILSLTNQTM